MTKTKKRKENGSSARGHTGRQRGGTPRLSGALTQHRQGNFAEAMLLYHSFLTENPTHTEALHLLACLYQQLGESENAILLEEKAVSLNARNCRYWYGLGVIAQSLGKGERALEAYREATEIEPGYAEAYNNQGVVFKEKQSFHQAEECFSKALGLRPDYEDAKHNLALLYLETGRLDEAKIVAEQCLKICPTHAEGWFNLANIHKSLGNIPEAVSCYRKALEINPGHHKVHSSLLFVLNYLPDISAKDLAEEHRRWGERFPCINSLPCYRGESDRKINIGYVSPDFRSHPVAFFIEGVLAHHDRQRFEVTAYANVRRPDAVTDRLCGKVDHWRDCRGRNAQEVAEWVRRDRIDILVDLAGHSADHLLEVFAIRPAPVQVAYLGYPNTSGLAAMDYRITDFFCDPPGVEELFSEKLIRLSGSFFCFCPPEGAPETGPPPVERNGYITFGSFNNLAKISPHILRHWVDLLNALPKSHLLMQSGGLENGHIQIRICDFFNRYGISSSRIAFHGHTGFFEHLNLLQHVDIALDSFPWNGHTTTCHTLWMGVPVVTLAGNRTAGRMGESILFNLGLEALVGKDPQDYIARAYYLATHPDLLAGLRKDLRQRIKGSSLADREAFTRRLEEVYLEIHRGKREMR